MDRKTTKILLIIFSVLLAAELIFVVAKKAASPSEEEQLYATDPAVTTEPVPTELATESTPAPTDDDTTQPQPSEPEAAKRYVLTFAGDCTLGSTAGKAGASSSFVSTIGTNYDYPFANVVEYFENDDFTIVNLEGPLTETGTAAAKTFAFKGPTAYTQILTGSSVEAVTLANNHSEDYGKEGYQNTAKALDDAGVCYVEKNKTAMYETESGLKIGLYAASFDFSKSNITSSISALRASGAEIVICAFHWGTEGSYRPTSSQEYFGRAAIEAGADIVYGSHPHVLQKVESYNGGYIFYSMGNFSFGGSTFPQDYDSAILQLEVLRDENGKVKLGELTRIPVSVSSVSGQNNYQPTPYKEGSKEYERALSKLDGSFKGADLVVDYSSLNGNATTPPTEGNDPTTGGSTTQPTTGSDAVPTPTTPAPAPTTPAPTPTTPTPSPAPSPEPAPGGDSGSSGDSGGSDSGSSGGEDSGAIGEG